MPHISVKQLPIEPDERRQSALASEVTEAVDSALGVEESVISIALESAAPEVWHEHVYVPEVAWPPGDAAQGPAVLTGRGGRRPTLGSRASDVAVTGGEPEGPDDHWINPPPWPTPHRTVHDQKDLPEVPALF